MSERNTVLNAAIGAAVSVVLTVLPFSPVLGGAVAGYLERGTATARKSGPSPASSRPSRWRCS